jgi:two-component system KDP operon response regulator KdpE
VSTEPLLLIVDDDQAIQRLVKLELEAEGFRVQTCGTGEEALTIAREQRPDLLVLDINLPDRQGLDVLGELRERSDVPVILLTGRTGTRDRVKGLDLGADDYVVKPFSPEELGARIRAVLRRRTRANAEAGSTVQAGEFTIDLDRRIVSTGDNETASLTRTEWALLQFLAEHPGKVMLSQQILSHVWGPEYIDDRQYLRVWVSRIRKKLSPEVIETFQGIGYRLVDEPDPEPPAEASAGADEL